MRDEGSVTYSAAIESAAQRDTDEESSPFATRVAREAVRRGFAQAARRAVLGDGAPWIWNLATEHFPDAVQILDRYHAKQHLSDVAKAIYGATSDLGKQWARAPRRVGRRQHRGATGRAAGPRRRQRRGAQVRRLHRDQPPENALPRVPRPGPMHLDRRGRGGLQSRHRHATQADGDALDGRRGQRHHRASVLHAQRPLRGLLGVAGPAAEGRVTFISQS